VLAPGWLKNVYFNFLMVMRAVTKAAPLWVPQRFHTGNEAQDEEVAAIVTELITAAPT
jgi:ERO1-like protein alpha/ERO1-like protein beta